MTHTIYLDILFCVNFIIDYMILVSVKKFLSLSCRLRRLLLGAAVGGLCSFVILLPPLPSGLSLIISLACACVVIGSAFAPISGRSFFRASAAFFLVSFGLCGVMMALLSLLSPQTLLIRNGTVYIEIPPLMLIIAAVFCYAVLRVIMRITGSGRTQELSCTVRFRFGERVIAFSGRVDTGNTLREPFSGMPVVVARRSALKSAPELLEDGTQGVKKRLIPFSSVGGEGFLYGFRADEMVVICSGVRHRVSAYIAPCEDERITGEEAAVIPYELIS